MDELRMIVKKEIKNKGWINLILEYIMLILYIFGVFTTMVFGVYLLPIEINSGLILKEYGWMLSIGVLGYGILSLYFLIKYLFK